MSKHFEEGGEHEAGAGEKVEGTESGSQAFVIAGQAADLLLRCELAVRRRGFWVWAAAGIGHSVTV